ncbi:methylenetetrahydrofolate reductase [Arthrobacter oryzae]|uniref:Methylenetetrahydrofolate reductase n=1 Tax=Arthrobacter oryzae TaxID=409290 RepID=A0A3N0CKH4_9MICC|nr:methylenetetrahydrofolate reductase [Arthrobacter oryzae]RNL63423.1 metFprotein [Arthrobacter oryzae]
MTSLEKNINDMATQISLEITPQDALTFASTAESLPCLTRVYITAIPGSDLFGLVAASEKIRKTGMTPVPHIPARSISSREELESLLTNLSQVGVADLLLLAGSAPQPAGEFASSIDVLKSGIVQSVGFKRVDVAGHPEGSPDVPSSELISALLTKQSWAKDTGIEMAIVTQFAFTGDAYISWLKDIRASGVELPVIFGLPGLAKISTLIRYGLKCGIGPSLRVFRKQAGSMLKLATGSYSPDPIIVGLAEGLDDDEISNQRVGLHVFPFGALRSSVRYLATLNAGRFAVDSDGTIRTTEDAGLARRDV